MAQGGARIRAIHIEDSSEDFELIHVALQRAGLDLDVVRVDNLPILETQLDLNPPDLILCDFSLPTLDGLQALRTVQERRPDVPFIFCSGTIGEERAVEALLKGAYDYVLKDNLRRLPGAIERALKRSEERAASRQLEERLRKSEAMYRSIVETAEEAICTLDPTGRLTYVNRKFCELLGRRESELLGRDLLALLDDAGAALLRAKLAMHRDLRETFEVAMTHKDGSRVVGLVSSSPLADASGAHSGSLMMVTDITERKRVDEHLRATREQLYQSQKMESLGRLAGGIAHDFNNLLGAIIGYADLLRDSLKGDARASDAELVLDCAQRGKELTRRLLTFSRKEKPEARTVELNALVSDLMRTVGPLVKGLSVQADLSAEPLEVELDPGRFGQVLLNLVVNARDAMDGRGRLQLRTAKLGGEALLEVADQGCGMDPETQGRIFEPFFTTKPAGVGTGLGLSTVYAIVQQSGGRIEVDSAPGKGTTFRVLLPLRAQVPA